VPEFHWKKNGNGRDCGRRRHAQNKSPPVDLSLKIKIAKKSGLEEECRSSGQEFGGTTDIPVNTFNKSMDNPEKSSSYENAQRGNRLWVTSKLKVMLEEDYLFYKNTR